MTMQGNQIVDLMDDWLCRNGYEVKNKKYWTQPGHDIEATAPNGTLFYIECKGSEPNGGGTEFGTGAKYDRAASAFFNQMRLRENEPQSEVGIAFPDDETYRSHMKALEEFCTRNRLRIFWVSEHSMNEW